VVFVDGFEDGAARLWSSSVGMELPCDWNSDCAFGFECHDHGCVESDCYWANGIIPAKECPDGFGCEYGDGVDFNHGNGVCVPNTG
jgi:hypothetical protein